MGKELARVTGRRPGVPEPWSIALHRAHVRIVSGEGEEIVVDRRDFVLSASVVPRSRDAYLYVRKPQKVTLLLDGDALAIVRAWIGVDLPRWMQADLQRRARSALLTAAGLGSLGLLFADLFLLAIAVLLVVQGMLQWAVVSRRLFLLEVGVVATVGALLTVDILFGHNAWWLLALSPLLYFAGAAGVRLHRFYGVQSPK
jgi:hypothetical protein